MRSTAVADAIHGAAADDLGALMAAVDREGPEALIARLETEMLEAARRLEFEQAASLRDRVDEIRHTLAAAKGLGLAGASTAADAKPSGRGSRSGSASGGTGVPRRGGRERSDGPRRGAESPAPPEATTDSAPYPREPRRIKRRFGPDR